jgi:hypothetical protein
MDVSKIDNDPYKVSYIQIALIFGFIALAVAVGVWGASKVSS